jgi:hypothetical protein
LHIVDSLTAPAPEIAVPQGHDHVCGAPEQFGGLPGTLFRAAQQSRMFESGTTRTPRRLPIHFQGFVRGKSRQFLCDGSSVADQGQTGRLHKGSLCRWKVSTAPRRRWLCNCAARKIALWAFHFVLKAISGLFIGNALQDVLTSM